MTPQEKLIKAREIWKQTVAYQREAEQCILKLLRHPDTTPEQLVECHQLTQRVEVMLRDLTTRLRKAYPPQRSVWLNALPWNNPEWDSYQQWDKHEADPQIQQTHG